MTARTKTHDMNLLTSPPSQILPDDSTLSRSPKKQNPTLSIMGNDRRTSLNPTLIDLKSPFASPKAQRVETLGNATNLSKMSTSYLADPNLIMKTLPGDDVSKLPKKPQGDTFKEIPKPRYDYSSQLLMYIPANINELSKSTVANKAFSSFNQMSQSMKNSHQKLLEGMLKEYKYPTTETSFEPTQSQFKSFETMDSVRKMLELNKLQKKSYASQIETEKRHVVLPLIQKVQENEVKTRRMPHVKKLPSRNIYNGNNMDAIIESPTIPDKGDMSSFDGYGGTFNSINDMGLKLDLGGDRRGSNRSGSVDDRTTDRPFGQATFKVYWNYNVIDKNMWRPYVREGHTLTTVGRQVILYGGISNCVMDEIIVYDPTRGAWSKPHVSGDIPLSGRHGHSACEYKRTLIIFGGEHEFNPTLNFRECLNDVYMFIPDKNEWKYLKSSTGMINSRRHHAAAIVDSTMYVYGGITNEGHYIKDFWSFNLKTCTWNQVDVEGDRENGIAFHTLTSCMMTRTGSNIRDKDKMKVFEEGLYAFGGKDSEGKILSVLKLLPIKSKDQKWKYLATKGVAPTARYNHTTLFYEPLAIIVVYGGRNDGMFEATRDICLKDLRILSLETLTWTSTSNFGDVPQIGRYHHAVAGYGTKMLIFGGVTYQSYANDEVKTLELNPGEVHKLIKEQQAMDGIVTEVKKGKKMPMASILKDRTEEIARLKTYKESKSVSINLRSFQPVPKDQDAAPAEEKTNSPRKNGKEKIMRALTKIMSS